LDQLVAAQIRSASGPTLAGVDILAGPEKKMKKERAGLGPSGKRHDLDMSVGLWKSSDHDQITQILICFALSKNVQIL
jgi:hypothetical protein